MLLEVKADISKNSKNNCMGKNFQTYLIFSIMLVTILVMVPVDMPFLSR